MKTRFIASALVTILGIFMFSVTYAFEGEDVQIHGFASQGFLKSNVNDYFFANTEDGTFEFNEFGLTISAFPSDGLRIGVQLLARDFGIFGNDNVTIDWAFVEYRPYNEIGLQCGKMKMPMGLYNQSRDVDVARTHILLPTSFYNEVTRESLLSLKGVNMLGYLTRLRLQYQVMYGVGTFPPDGDYSRYLLETAGIPIIESHLDPSLIANIQWQTPLSGLTLGGNFLIVPEFSFFMPLGPDLPLGKYQNEWVETVGFAEYQKNRFVFTFEHAFDTISSELVGFQPESESTSQSFYYRAGYQVTDQIQIGGYYSVIYRDKDDKDGESYEANGQPAALAWNKQLTASVRFDLIDNLILKLEAHHFDGLYYVRYDETDPDDTGLLFASKVTAYF